MTSRFLALLVSIAILSATAPIRAGQAGEDSQFRVRIESSNVDTLRAWLESTGYDVLGSDAATSTVDVAVSRTELHGLRSLGLAHRVSRTRASAGSNRGRARAAESGGRTIHLPPPRSPPATSIWAGINARLQPDCRRVSQHRPGRRHHRRIQCAADLRRPPHLCVAASRTMCQVDEDEPAMLVATTHHAREISTPSSRSKPSARLTAGYGVDERITNAVDRTRSGLPRSGIPTATTTSLRPTTSGEKIVASSRTGSASTRTGTTRRPGAPARWQHERQFETYKGPSAVIGSRKRGR